MKFLKTKFLSALLVSFSLFFLQGCEDSQQLEVNRIAKNDYILYQKAVKDYKSLEQYVNSGANGKYVTTLKIALSQIKAEMPNNEALVDLEKQFKKDMTVKGTVFESIKKDYNDVMLRPEIKVISDWNANTNYDKKDYNKLLNLNKELFNLNQILKKENFDNRFIDYINTLSAISPTINPVVVGNLDKTDAVGSAFVGNPNYGQWVKDSNGNSHWEFLETYLYLSFLNNMLFDNNYSHSYGAYHRGYYNNPYKYNSGYSSKYRYDNWSNKRNYSYYNDTYVKSYAPAKEKAVYKRYQSNLTKQYKGSIKTNNNLATQNKKMMSDPRYKRYQPNIINKSLNKNKYSPKFNQSIRNVNSNPSKSSGK